MTVGLFAAVAVVSGCGDRADVYDADIGNVQTFGLSTQVAIIDDGAHRVVLATPGQGQELARTALPIGENVLAAQASPDKTRLFVLSLGASTRKKASDEKPSLTVLEAKTATSEASERRYPLESPHSGMAIDPEGRWVALFAAQGGGQANLVENPNEIILIDLTAPIDTAITTRTIRSFGALPQRVSFTPTLLLPAGPRRLLVVETNQDLALLDLDNLRATPARPEVTVRLSNGSSAVVNQPAGVVFDDGDPAKNDDARIGVRLANGTSVVTLTLVANVPGATTDDPAMVPNDFRPLVNLTDVGGVPGQIAFVRTDLGRRLAAIVPTTRKAVLVDPDTSVTTSVALPDAYAQLSLVTAEAGDASGADTALLYGPSSSGVALWSLGRAGGQPYRSVEVIALNGQVANVIDVPAPHAQLKILQTAGASTFYVMDLVARTASPLVTQGAATLSVAADGQRLWAYRTGGTDLAQIALGDLHPVPVTLDRPIGALYDVALSGGGRSLVAINARGTVSATVLDAAKPDATQSKSYFSILLEGL